jgi:hypothetical protein
MSEEAVSIQDIINMNTNYNGILKIEPVVTNKTDYILIKSKHFEQPEKIVIIFTGINTVSDNAVKNIKEYYLTETLDDGYIEIYTKPGETLEESFKCQILSDNGLSQTNQGCGIMGGKRKRRKTKKNKKIKSKKGKSKSKSKSKRRMRK